MEAERSLSKIWVELRETLRPFWSEGNDRAELLIKEPLLDGFLQGDSLTS